MRVGELVRLVFFFFFFVGEKKKKFFCHDSVVGWDEIMKIYESKIKLYRLHLVPSVASDFRLCNE